MNLFVLIVIVFSSTFVFAKEDGQKCANYAKYQAIRKYKADVGLVQGSEGMESTAKLVKATTTQYEYVVEISDNDEEGEFWILAYTVTLNKQTCKRVSISESETIASSEEEL